MDDEILKEYLDYRKTEVQDIISDIFTLMSEIIYNEINEYTVLNLQNIQQIIGINN